MADERAQGPDAQPGQALRAQADPLPGKPERFQAFLAGEIDAAPGLAVIFGREQGLEMKIVASVCQEAKGDKYFTTTYMVKDDGPVKRVQDLKGGTIGVVGIKTATDLWARAGLLNAGLVPDKDTKVVPMAFRDRRGGAHRQSHRRHLRRAFLLSRDGERRPAQALHRHRRDGLRPRALDIFFGEKFLKQHPDAVRAFLADYVAVTQWYLANTEQAKTDLHKAGFVRTALEAYLKTADWKRDPNAGGRREPEEALGLHARQAAVAREAGERRLDGRPELPAALKNCSSTARSGAGARLRTRPSAGSPARVLP